MDKKEYDRQRYLRLKEKIDAKNKLWWREHGKEFERKRYAEQKDKRKAICKASYLLHRDKRLAKAKIYREEHPEVYERGYKKYYLNPKNHIKILSRSRTNCKRYYGPLKKDKCVACGSVANLQFHHLDYENDIVEVLCMPCHKKRHRKEIGLNGL
jgi:hypothetical protein